MAQFRMTQLGDRLNQVVFLDFGRPLKVQVLEQCLHLLEVATVHENGADATQELIEIDVLLLSLVEQAQNAFQNLGWVL